MTDKIFTQKYQVRKRPALNIPLEDLFYSQLKNKMNTRQISCVAEYLFAL